MKSTKPLSPSQEVIVGHLIHGLTTKEIAKAMNRSKSTVDNHMLSIHRRLNVTTGTAVVSWYWRQRVAELEARIAKLEGAAK